MLGRKRITAAARPAAGLLLLMLLTSCGGDGSVDVPTPSESITGSLPSPTRTPTRTPSLSPSESASPTTSPTASESPIPSESPSESESPDETSPPPSEAPPSVEPTEAEPTPSPPAEEPAEEPADATESEEDQDLPAWFWWVLAGLGLLGAVLAAILVPRARRRTTWDTDLATQQDEVTWFARELVPALQQTGSPDAVAGGWQVAAARVSRAEDQLTGLESTAPDGARGARARSLRDAVRAARQGIEHLIVSRDPAALSRDLGAIGNQLQAALERDQARRTVAQ